MRVPTFAVLLLLVSHALAGWRYDCDFSVRDEGGFPYSVDVERRSAYSHRHGRIREDGRYVVLLAGNRHYVPSPDLSDFTFRVSGRMELFRTDVWDFSLFFRNGCVLTIRRLKDNRIAAFFDGREIASVESHGGASVEPFTLILEVVGSRGRIVFGDLVADFEAPDGQGRVGLDLGDWEGNSSIAVKMVLDELSVESPETPEMEWERPYRITLPCDQGANEAPVYDVRLVRYKSGATEIELSLSGLSIGRGERMEIGSGASQYLGAWERMTDPYVRIDTPTGEYRNILLWNGTKLLYDREMHTRPDSPSSRHADIPWPRRMRMVVRDFPEVYTIAAGYGHLQAKPVRFCEDGPAETVVDSSGHELWHGRSIRGSGVGFRASSPVDKKLVSRIPAGVWNREGALNHAREQHYFYPDEVIKFDIEAVWRTNATSEAELNPAPRFTMFFDEPVGSSSVLALDAEDIGGGLRRRTWRTELSERLGTGVYKVVWDRPDGFQECEIFEVLSEDPSILPPVASGLPFLMEMSNELRYNEQSAFDPWGEHGGYSHCYSAISRYPLIAEEQRIWELLPVFGRKWMHWGRPRVQKDCDMYSPWNQNLIRHADFFGGFDNRRHPKGRYDLCNREMYTHDIMDFLADFAKEHRPPFKVLSDDAIRERRERGECLSEAEFRDLFETCWDEWCEYARKKIAENVDAFLAYVRSLNPNVARVTYGPFPLYVSCYKTAYSLKYLGFHVETDPRVRDAGSYWQLEHYPHWCDYPYYRANMFVATYGLFYGKTGRRIYPELNGPIYEFCVDGAVNRALPEDVGLLANTHHRKNVYQFVYATGYFRDGTYGFWTDDGYHYQFPERKDLDEMFHAWKLMRNHRPVAAAKAPFIVLDLGEISRYGDFMDDNGMVCNAAEEGLAWAYEALVTGGWNTPIFTDYSEIDRIRPQDCEFLVLPPRTEKTPKSVLDAIERAKGRGIKVVDPGFEPTRVNRASVTCGFHFGAASLDERQKDEFRAKAAAAAPNPAVKTEDGLVTATYDAEGNLVVVLSDVTPLHGDSSPSVHTFRFSVALPGIGGRAIETDADAYRVFSCANDRVEIRVARGRDTAVFFCFKDKNSKRGKQQ